MPIDSWNNAPSVLTEWTGRDNLLKQITKDWNDPKKEVTGLIGFGGEGKSSLARKWVDNLLQSSTQPQPEGIFWWGFYENSSVDEFLEAALNYLSGGRIDPHTAPSSNVRAQIIGAMLGAGRFLFVLDGFEVMQYQDGDQYGLTQSNDLRDLLTFFARPDNQSFCLITSRSSLLDLMEYTTYTHRDVDRLLPEDGRDLLKRLGIHGTDAQLDKIVSDWDGHALTISLLASYLAEKQGGDIAYLNDIPVPTTDEPRYERVHRVLRRYDEHLTEAEREFLKLFSAFRTAVHENAFLKVFQPLLTSYFSSKEVKSVKIERKRSFLARIFGSKTDSPILDSQSTQSRIAELVTRLVAYRILSHDVALQTYTAHPLVRNHYFVILTQDTRAPTIHLKIKGYYLSQAGDTPAYPTLDDLKPLIEAVHHACRAGTYDEAYNIYWNKIERGSSPNVLIYILGSYETEINLIQEFFANGDISQEPLVSGKGSQRLILNRIGFCLMSLGRLRQAVPFYERVSAIDQPLRDNLSGTSASEKLSFDIQSGRGEAWNSDIQEWVKFHFQPGGSLEIARAAAHRTLIQTRREKLSGASATFRNLAELHAQLGALEASVDAASQALDLSRRAENKQDECYSLARLAWAENLQGKLEQARHNFSKAEQKKKEAEPSTKYLYSDLGIFYADYLHRIGQSDHARRVTEVNLQICERQHWANQISWCHRVLGDLDLDSGNYDSAYEHYESAFKIVRSIQRRDVLIEILLARGRWAAKYMNDSDAAFNNLNEALGYCVESGYRIYEADVRVALAWAYLANGEKEKAKESAERAKQMSNEMGYHWGKVDAEEVLERIESGE